MEKTTGASTLNLDPQYFWWHFSSFNMELTGTAHNRPFLVTWLNVTLRTCGANSCWLNVLVVSVSICGLSCTDWCTCVTVEDWRKKRESNLRRKKSELARRRNCGWQRNVGEWRRKDWDKQWLRSRRGGSWRSSDLKPSVSRWTPHAFLLRALVVALAPDVLNNLRKILSLAQVFPKLILSLPKLWS